MKNDVQALYICDAEVVKVASSLLPEVRLHPLDLVPSAATFSYSLVLMRTTFLTHASIRPLDCCGNVATEVWAGNALRGLVA